MKLIYLFLGVAALASVAYLLARGRQPSVPAPEPPSSACSPEELWRTLEVSGVWFALEEPPDKSGNVLYVEPRRGDGWIFPIFSSAELAEQYLASIVPTYEKRSPRGDMPAGVAAFPLLQGDPSFIGQNTWHPGQLVLNPETAFERVFSTADLDHFKSREGK